MLLVLVMVNQFLDNFYPLQVILSWHTCGGLCGNFESLSLFTICHMQLVSCGHGQDSGLIVKILNQSYNETNKEQLMDWLLQLMKSFIRSQWSNECHLSGIYLKAIHKFCWNQAAITASECCWCQIKELFDMFTYWWSSWSHHRIPPRTRGWGATGPSRQVV